MKVINPQQAKSILKWYIDQGVDETIGETAEPMLSSAKPPAAVPQISKPASPQERQPTTATLEPIEAIAAKAEAVAAAAGTLSELREAIISFEGCSLKNTAMNTVFCDGNPEADLMLVGEAPGAEEDRQGRPFVGVSGQLLDRMLAAIGRDRRSSYIANIIPWRPPGNRNPTPHEIRICLPFIRRHIELQSPKALILVGGVSAQSLLATSEGITRMRGRWQTLEVGKLNVEALPTFHPAYLLRRPGAKKRAWQDFMAAEARLAMTN